MTAEIDAVAFEIFCSGDAADVVAGFEDDWFDVGVLEEFVGSCEACGAGAGDNGNFLFHTDCGGEWEIRTPAAGFPALAI